MGRLSVSRRRVNEGWAPAAAGLVLALVVGAVVVVLADDGDRDAVVTLPPAAEAASSTPEPSPFPLASSQAATAVPAPDDSPVSSDDPPASAAGAPRPSSQPAPAPAPSRTRPPGAPAPTRTAAPPSSPKPSTAVARAAFSFDAAYGTDEPREVVVQYGDSSSCPHARVTHTVQETAERVVVTLEADAMDPGRACTADYRQMLVYVALASPMGDRVLVDGSRNEPVKVDRSCQRDFANPPPPKDCEPA